MHSAPTILPDLSCKGPCVQVGSVYAYNASDDLPYEWRWRITCYLVDYSLPYFSCGGWYRDGCRLPPTPCGILMKLEEKDKEEEEARPHVVFLLCFERRFYPPLPPTNIFCPETLRFL